MRMTRSRVMNSKHNCVVCSQEISVNKEISQPHNPRKVFKVCSNYLRPEVFTKYSKWDYLSSLERQSPFCSNCVKSGEKLSTMNDRLEEIQKEIKSFVKYFAKEINLLHSSDDENSGDDGDENEESINASKRASLRSSSRISSSNNLNSQEIQSLNARLDSVRAKTDTMTMTIVSKEEDSNSGNELVVIKQEFEERESTGDYGDEDYVVPSSSEGEDDEDDEEYDPNASKSKKLKSKTENENPEIKANVQDATTASATTTESSTTKRKGVVRVNWKEISYSEEKLKVEWTRKSLNDRGRCLTEYFYCKIGGKKCPCKLLKRYYGGIRYYLNGKDHYHFKKRGVSLEVKQQVQKMLEEDPMAKPEFILESLKCKGVELQKSKLKNLLVSVKRKILIKSGLYEKLRAENTVAPTPGQKRKRGRPSGSRNIIFPLSVHDLQLEQPPPPAPDASNNIKSDIKCNTPSWPADLDESVIPNNK